MAHGHSHGGVACDGNHTRMNDDPVKKRRKAKKNRKDKDRSTSNRKGKKNKNSAIPCCSKERGIPRHCCCHELCCGWNGCGKRHNIKHLPLFQCMDPKKYRPGQRRRHSRCWYCCRNVGNWITFFFILIGLGGAIAALALYLAPCKPNISYSTNLRNRTVANSSVVKTVNYNYDGANVFIMLDFSGSISSVYDQEIESAEMILDYFKTNLHAQAPFHAGAIRWSSTVSYLTASGVDAKLGPDIDITARALKEQKGVSPTGGTEFGGPMFWAWREFQERSTGAVDIDPANTHHNFAIFVTDGEPQDYMNSGSLKYPYNGETLDRPFAPGGSYSGSLNSATSQGICVPKGWTDAECKTANVIRTVKDLPNTKVMGIFVGDKDVGQNGVPVLHNASSCDEYTFDQNTWTSPCPFFTSADNFNELKLALDDLMSKLAAEVSVSSKVVTEERVVEELVTDEIVEEVYTCEKNTDVLLLALLLLPLLIWLMAVPT